LKGWTTGRETQRGPKSAREQAVSREKWLFCQMKRPILGAKPESSRFSRRLGRSGRQRTRHDRLLLRPGEAASLDFRYMNLKHFQRVVLQNSGAYAGL
jgi:hypothetical protein